MPCTTAGAPSWHKLVAVYAQLQVPAHFDLSTDATSAASLLLDPWAHEPSDLDDDDEEEEAAATAAGGEEEDPPNSPAHPSRADEEEEPPNSPLPLLSQSEHPPSIQPEGSGIPSSPSSPPPASRGRAGTAETGRNITGATMGLSTSHPGGGAAPGGGLH